MTTLGQRCVDVAMAEFKAGVREVPAGSNSGPRVREYLAPCVRGDRNVRLGLTASNWCMAFASWCLYQALRSTDKAPPHGYRAGVVEALADAQDPNARWTGRWKPIIDVRSGVWFPKPGDLAIYDRSQHGRPDTSWWRHVNRVVSFDMPSGDFVTVGGNELQKVHVGTQQLSNVKLLGFVAYPREEKIEQSKPLLTSVERTQIAHMVFLSIDGMMRDSLYDGKPHEED